MCGITGFFDARRDTVDDVLAERVRDMTRTIEHRGPDQGGQWVDGPDGIALGNRRLAIIDLSPLGDQPMFSASGRFVLVFNGEIYNYKDLRDRLIDEGHSFTGGSDTEVVVTAVEAWGIPATLDACNGMFAFALWDRSDKKLYLARDRFGEKPLYYGWMGRELLFGSELKALKAHPSFRGDIDRDALELFMRHKYVPTPFSIYRGVKKLPAGTFVEFGYGDAGRDVAPVTFHDAAAIAERGIADPFSGSDDEAVDHLDALLTEAVGMRMVADVPLGAFLSGGVDSSTVVALMQSQSSLPVKTFTIGLPEDGYNEAQYAGAVARHLGTDHTELLLTPDEVRSVVPLLPAMYDEPFADSSQIPTYLVSKLAREHVTVSLSGDGGDEVFGGYNRYVWVEKIWRKARSAPAGLRSLAASGLTSLSPQRWDALFRFAAPVLPASAKHRVPGDKLHKLAAALSVPDERAMYTQLISHWPEGSGVVLGATGTTNGAFGSTAELGSFTNQMMYLDLVTYLVDDILVKFDRASMAVSLEGRVPMLDPRVVEFAWRLPFSMKIRDGETKWALRRVLDRYVPRELIDRPKSGFGVPIDSWLRGPLREWAESLLDPGRLAAEGYFDPAPITTRWNEFQSGKRSWQYLLWDVLMFQSWLEAERSSHAAVTHVA